MAKTVLHLFHDDDASLDIGSRAAQRVAEVAAERGIDLEVMILGPAQHRLADAAPAYAAYNARIDDLVRTGVAVTACVNLARAGSTEDALRARGLGLEVARDAFVRFTLEGATVINF